MCHFEGVEFHCKTVFWGGGGATTQEPIKKRHSVLKQSHTAIRQRHRPSPTRATSKRPMGCRVSLVFQNFDTGFKKNRWSLLPRTPPLQIPTIYVLTEDALDWTRQRLNECFLYTKRSFRAHRQK